MKRIRLRFGAIAIRSSRRFPRWAPHELHEGLIPPQAQLATGSQTGADETMTAISTHPQSRSAAARIVDDVLVSQAASSQPLGLGVADLHELMQAVTETTQRLQATHVSLQNQVAT